MLEVCNNPDALSLRDKMILMILYNTGCRVSELVNLCVSDISIETDGTSSIRFLGKGRKERITPIWKSTAVFINNYIKLQPSFIKQSKREFNTIRRRTADNHDHRKSCRTVPISEQEKCHTPYVPT